MLTQQTVLCSSIKVPGPVALFLKRLQYISHSISLVFVALSVLIVTTHICLAQSAGTLNLVLFQKAFLEYHFIK